MSRLYDRIMVNGLKAVQSDGSTVFRTGQVMEDLRQAQVFTCENVADYYFYGTDQEEWDWVEDFPNVAGPFETFWMETRRPRWSWSKEYGWNDMRQSGYPVAWGALFRTGPAEILPPALHNMITENTVDELWRVNVAALIVEYAKGRILGPLGVYTMGLKSDGGLARKDDPDGPYPALVSPWMNWGIGENEVAKEIEKALQPFMLSLTFLNCKNVVTRIEEPPAKLSRRHQKKHGQPLTSYRVLEIEPLRKAAAHQGGGVSGMRKALHISRGHFKTFGGDHGKLFGKHEGMYWWDPHVRGDRKAGKVEKTYAVKVPQDGTEVAE